MNTQTIDLINFHKKTAKYYGLTQDNKILEIYGKVDNERYVVTYLGSTIPRFKKKSHIKEIFDLNKLELLRLLYE